MKSCKHITVPTNVNIATQSKGTSLNILQTQQMQTLQGRVNENL